MSSSLLYGTFLEADNDAPGLRGPLQDFVHDVTLMSGMSPTDCDKSKSCL